MNFQMPPELEQFRGLIQNTGGNRVEDLIDRFYNEDHLSKTNLPVFVMAVAVSSQVDLLKILYARELLKCHSTK